MLTEPDNVLLTRTGPKTPMGDLFRRFWQPVLLSAELPEPDGPPVRVMILGEDLRAFRTTDGSVGLVSPRCPHRGADLFFGRNEEGGIRCVYHGWKFAVDGRCLALPTMDPGPARPPRMFSFPRSCNNAIGRRRARADSTPRIFRSCTWRFRMPTTSPRGC
jgi:phthalate 4,5-dioxygenase oxygenase subunit